MLLVRTCIILLLDLNVISFSLIGKKKAKGLPTHHCDVVGRPELKSNLADSQLGSRGHLREQGACVHKARNVQFSQTVVVSNYKHVTVDLYILI